jgi:AraC-like DNA-binding protein
MMAATTPFYEIKNWTHQPTDGAGAQVAHNDCFCILFVQSGQLQFDLGRQSFHLHTGHVLIDKPDYDFSLKPEAGQYTVFNFTNTFYEQLQEDLPLQRSGFFANPGQLSLPLQATPDVAYRHYRILQAQQAGRLAVDQMVTALVGRLVDYIKNEPAGAVSVSRSIHLSAIERAKAFVLEQFATDFSLFELARQACVSPFHFSRIFQQGTGLTPHRYVLQVRLAHSRMLLEETGLPVTDVAFQSGFCNPDYFATAFKRYFGVSPGQYRRRIRG